MTLIQLAKYSFSDFKQLKEAKNLSLGTVIGYLVLLSSLMTIPIGIQLFQVYQNIQDDGLEIAKQIPDFTIVDGRIVTENAESGFIYQTNSIILTFDPVGHRTSEDVAQDVIANNIAVGLLTDKIVVALPANDLTSSFFGTNQFEFSYDSLEDINGEVLREAFSNTQIPIWIYLLGFAFLWYGSFISALFTLLISTLFANIFARFRSVVYSFLEILKIIVFSSTLPICLSILISLVAPQFNSSSFIILTSLFIFSQAVKKTN